MAKKEHLLQELHDLSTRYQYQNKKLKTLTIESAALANKIEAVQKRGGEESLRFEKHDLASLRLKFEQERRALKNDELAATICQGVLQNRWGGGTRLHHVVLNVERKVLGDTLLLSRDVAATTSVEDEDE